MERKRRLKIATAIVGAPMALWAGVACGGESPKNKSLAQVGSTPIVGAEKMPETAGELKSRRIGQPVGEFKIGNAGGETLDYQKDLAGRAVIIFYCCQGSTEQDIEKIESLKQKYDQTKLVVVNVVLANRSNKLVAPIIAEDTAQNGSSYDAFSGNGIPYLVAIDKDGILRDQRRGGNTVSAGIDDLARKLANGEEFVPTVVVPKQVPTVEPTSVREVKNPDSREAVLDAGNFDLAISGWEEFSVEPYQTRVFSGKAGDTGTVVNLKHVVVKAIFRNKTDEWKDLSGLDIQAGGTYNIQFIDSDGEPVHFAQEAVVPVEYKGVFDEPFELSQGGTVRIIREFSPRSNLKQSTFMAPGFGLPVFFVGQMPADMKDYGIHFYYQPIGGMASDGIVRKGQIAGDFSLIAPDAQISDVDESLDLSIEGGSFQVKFLGSGTTRSADTISHKVILFDAKNNIGSDLNPLNWAAGTVYLKDGRAVPIARFSDSFASEQGSVRRSFLGTDTARTDFPGSSVDGLRSAFNFDLKGSVVVLKIFDQWKAWRMPETPSVPGGMGE